MVDVWIVVAGLGVGLVFGAFGAGGSAFATPVLALLGVPPLLAVASPLPAMIPASVAGARHYLRSGQLDRRVAALSIAGGVPAVLVGAAISKVVGGPALLVLSGLMLAVVGLRMVLPVHPDSAARCRKRREHTATVVALAATVGFLTGLLANGGGFLLVPVFVLVLGLFAGEAAGTSMVAVAALTIPTLAAHWWLGHIDWAVAAAFAAGLIPASLVGARIGTRLPDRVARPAFGGLLIAFSGYFLIHHFT